MARAPEHCDLERLVKTAVAEAACARPGLPGPGEGLCELLHARLGGETNPGEVLRSIAIADLHLARLCAAGNSDALAAFEAEVMPKVRAAIARVDATEHFVDEAAQGVRERLFVARGGDAPRISQYSGDGALANWARVVGVRTAVNLKQSRSSAPPDDLAGLALSDADPELAYLRAQLKGAFEEALGDAMATLSAIDRNILRLRIVDGLSLERIGGLYQIHKSTVSRRIDHIRAALIEQTRAALHRRYGIGARELLSAMSVFANPFPVSVVGLLRRAAE